MLYSEFIEKCEYSFCIGIYENFKIHFLQYTKYFKYTYSLKKYI